MRRYLCFLAAAALWAVVLLTAGGAGGQESAAGPPGTEYTLVVGDRIQLVVDGKEEYGREMSVPANGEVSMPPIGRLRLLGRTTAELEIEIAKRLVERGVLQNPSVFVLISEYAPRQVFLIGAVTSRIPLPVHTRYGILEVLSMAGVSPAAADFRNITIMRRREDGEPFRFTVNVEDVLVKGDFRKNVIVMSNDVIYITALKDLSQTAYVYVLGKVGSPGRYPFMPGRDTMTLTKLIALAGDFHQFAQQSAVKILRKEGNRTISIEVDFDEIIDLEQQDVVLQPDDLVYVPESPI